VEFLSGKVQGSREVINQSVNRLLRFEEVHITVKGITDENRDFLTQVAMERDEQMLMLVPGEVSAPFGHDHVS